MHSANEKEQKIERCQNALKSPEPGGKKKRPRDTEAALVGQRLSQSSLHKAAYSGTGCAAQLDALNTSQQLRWRYRGLHICEMFF